MSGILETAAAIVGSKVKFSTNILQGLEKRKNDLFAAPSNAQLRCRELTYDNHPRPVGFREIGHCKAMGIDTSLHTRATRTATPRCNLKAVKVHFREQSRESGHFFDF